MLCVYSSSSTEAQRLLFGHSQAGALAPLFAGFLDTRNGPKREAASYRAIAAGLHLPAVGVLSLSGVEAELDTAAAARLCRCQLVRPADGTIVSASARHPVADDLPAMAKLSGLPASA